MVSFSHGSARGFAYAEGGGRCLTASQDSSALSAPLYERAIPIMTMIFDGHNDALLRLWRQGDQTGASFIRGDAGGQLDLPQARQGGFAGGLFAMFTPAPDKPGDILNMDPVDHAEALSATEAMF